MPAHTCESGAHFVKAHGTKNAFCFCAAQPQSAATLAIFQLYNNAHIRPHFKMKNPAPLLRFLRNTVQGSFLLRWPALLFNWLQTSMNTG
jgi:hypothetical protein